MSTKSDNRVLIVGIGNLLMGDEGVGVHVVRSLINSDLPDGIECLDGGTGGFHLLGALQGARKIVLVDATIDGSPPGTVRKLRPRFSKDYPRTLTAHDIGLKDLLDAFYLIGDRPDVTLLAVSISQLDNLTVELSPRVAARLDEVADMALAEALS
jgi:hydrogenase maturation protease